MCLPSESELKYMYDFHLTARNAIPLVRPACGCTAKIAFVDTSGSSSSYVLWTPCTSFNHQTFHPRTAIATRHAVYNSTMFVKRCATSCLHMHPNPTNVYP